MASGFLGTGFHFPLSVDKNTGRFLEASGAQSVAESVKIILNTHIGERLAAPEFGSNLNRYAFEMMDITLMSSMERDICAVLLDNEPRIDDVETSVYRDNEDYSKLIVEIHYRIAGRNSSENLVFPFFTEGI